MPRPRNYHFHCTRYGRTSPVTGVIIGDVDAKIENKAGNLMIDDMGRNDENNENKEELDNNDEQQ